MRLQPLGGLFLGRATNLADHDDAFRLGIVREPFEAVNKIRAVEGVATNPDARRLAQAGHGRLMDGLVRQGTRPRHNSNLALRVDVARHDADLALAGLDNSGAVRADQSRRGLPLQMVLDLDLCGNQTVS